jgi:hypothetical protein
MEVGASKLQNNPEIRMEGLRETMKTSVRPAAYVPAEIPESQPRALLVCSLLVHEADKIHSVLVSLYGTAA